MNMFDGYSQDGNSGGKFDTSSTMPIYSTNKILCAF